MTQDIPMDERGEPWSDEDLTALEGRLAHWPSALDGQVMTGLPPRLDDDLARAYQAIRWLRALSRPAPIDDGGLRDEVEKQSLVVRQHIGWLKMFAEAMTANNWRDTQDRISAQLAGLSEDAHALANFARRVASSPALPGVTWQPIENAPKDGRWFLAGAHGCQPIIGTWDGHNHHPRNARSADRIYPTHWMRLPEPPAALSPLQENT